MATSLNQSISIDSIEFEAIAKKIQGNILRAHGRDHAFHLFLRFKNRDKALALIKKQIVPKITTAFIQKENSIAFKTNPRKRFKRFLNFSLSKSGYEFLGIESNKIPDDQVFQDGMKNRIQKLKDPILANWQSDFQDDWHAIIIVANSSLKILNRLANNLKKKLKSDSIESIHLEIGSGIRNSKGDHIEHFGYVDGISQPHLLDDKVKNGTTSINNWDPRANMDTALVIDKAGSGKDAFGSYLVFRKLEQNVKAFHVAEQNLADQLGVSKDIAGAQMVGRFRNGNPLIPVSPPTSDSSGKMNDFNYSTDTANASKCPFHAHIRKTNPRGSGGAESPQAEKKHLFPRRGITYGIDFTASDKHPEKDVGLLFMAYNSDIDNQFEFMQRNWANLPSFPFNKPNGSHGIDPIIGQGNDNKGQNHYETWGKDSSVKRVSPSIGGFVTMKGGEYFFTPSMSFLKSL